MTRIDKPALDYLLDCAQQIGFSPVILDSTETAGQPPRVTITFEQQIEKAAPIHDLNPAPIESLAPAFAAVTEEQVKEIAEKGKSNLFVTLDKMKTLDEDEGIDY